MPTARSNDTGKTILLVIEPDSATRSGMKRLLEMNGFVVTAVADEREAAIAARQIIFDLILVDSDLPPPASFAAAHRIHQLAELRNTPVLVISVHGKSNIGPRHLNADNFSVAYMTKVSRFDELEKLIDCLVTIKV